MWLKYKMPRMRKGRKYQKKRKGARRYGKKMARVAHSYKREVFIGTVNTQITSAGAASNYQGGYAFRLSDLPNNAEYAALYDQYKITGVSFKIMPKWQNPGNGANSNTVSGVGQIITVIDNDDASNTFTKDDLLQYRTCKVTTPGRVHKRFIVPKMLNAVYRTGVTFAYNSVACKWIDMTLTDVPTYGIKMWIDPPVQNSLVAVPITPLQIPYDIYATYYFKCKNTR